MRVFGLNPLDLVRYGGQSLLWDRAMRGALSVAGPTVVGVALGDAELGLIATICALWPWINDLGGELKDRLVNMATSGDAILLGGVLAWLDDRLRRQYAVETGGSVRARLHLGDFPEPLAAHRRRLSACAARPPGSPWPAPAAAAR